MIQAEKIQSNYNKHLQIVEAYITSPRKQQVLDMIQSFSDNYVLAPASTKSWYHNAFPGGYVDHVNRVVRIALKQKQLYTELSGTPSDYTEEELVFAALFHDLGKLGTPDNPGYLQQTDKWRQDKLSEMYTPNKELQFMPVQDRSLFTLQSFGIKITNKEYLGIRAHDGLYDEANKPYYIGFQESSKLKTNLVHILHIADFLASKIEYELWKNSGGSSTPKVTKTKTTSGKQVKASENLTNLVKNL